MTTLRHRHVPSPGPSTVAATRFQLPLRVHVQCVAALRWRGRALRQCRKGEDPEFETARRGERRFVSWRIGWLCRRFDNHQQLSGHGFRNGAFGFVGVVHRRTRRSNQGRWRRNFRLHVYGFCRRLYGGGFIGALDSASGIVTVRDCVAEVAVEEGMRQADSARSSCRPTLPSSSAVRCPEQ